MRFRRFIAALMILLSLTAQARTAFACAMMPGAAMAHCCCPSDSKDQCPESVVGHPCCEVVTSTDAPLSHATATASLGYPARDGSIESLPVAAIESHFRPAAFDSGDRRPLYARPGSDQYRVRPQYLLTARLRL